MENQEPKKKKNVYLISALVFAVLFILPLGSVYFLSSGANYRKASLAELEKKGPVGDFSLINQNNQTVSTENLKGKVAVVHFLSDDFSIAKNQTERIGKVHQSFNDVEDVVFLSITKSSSTNELMDKATDLGITDNKQWFLLHAEEQNWDNLSKAVFNLKDITNSVALIDTSMTIRRYYDINSNPEMGRLVEQIAIVIPKQPRRGM